MGVGLASLAPVGALGVGVGLGTGGEMLALVRVHALAGGRRAT